MILYQHESKSLIEEILALLNEQAKLPCSLVLMQNKEGVYKIEPAEELSLPMVAGIRGFIKGYFAGKECCIDKMIEKLLLEATDVYYTEADQTYKQTESSVEQRAPQQKPAWTPPKPRVSHALQCNIVFD